MTTTPVLPSLPEPAMRAAPVGQEAWPFPRVGYYTAEQMNEHARRAIESLSRAPASSPLGLNADWALAMAEALGTDSGFSVPIVPSVEAFQALFNAVRSRAPAEPAETEAWLVVMSDGRKSVFRHNAIGDYRSLDPGAKVVELVPRGSGSHPTESAGPAAAQPIAEGLLQSACARMLANANWSVAGALSPASKRKDFPSNGWASVKLRDLASVRDTLSAASGDSTESAGPDPAEVVRELVEALRGLDEAYCRAGQPLSKDERHEDRMRLIAARAAIKLGESHEG